MLQHGRASEELFHLIRGDGIELAPIYDVMGAKVWPGITENLALDVDDKRRGEYIKGWH